MKSVVSMRLGFTQDTGLKPVEGRTDDLAWAAAAPHLPVPTAELLNY